MGVKEFIMDNPIIMIGLVIFIILLFTPTPGDELIGLLTMAFGAAAQLAGAFGKKKKKK